MLLQTEEFPQVCPVHQSRAGHLHGAVMREMLCKILPQQFMFPTTSDAERKAMLEALLPLFVWSDYGDVPFDLTFWLLTNFRQDACRFFFDMISRWLVPGKRPNVPLFSAIDFNFPTISGQVYTLAELVLRLDNASDFAVLRRNLPIIESEMRVGVTSAYHARRILEIKGMSGDEKTAMIQENIAYVLKRQKERFGEDVFIEMQHFLVKCGDRFKASHAARHMSRIICVHYYYRKLLRDTVAGRSDRRHLAVKLLKASVWRGGNRHKVLGIFVAVNLLRPNEVFDQRHLLGAVSFHIPNVKGCEGSTLVNRPRDDTIHTLYLEVEKEDGSDFSGVEIRRLRKKLPSDVKGRIEHPMHSVFMPQNHEEVMRNILILSNQLKYVRDLPQVIISFLEQTDVDLIFTVVLLRVLKRSYQPLVDLFKPLDEKCRFIPELVKVVGHVRKKYPKEANVFRLCLKKEVFLRVDHSLDLYQARHTVNALLEEAIGSFRDFNGGMIAKQEEVLSKLRESLGDLAKRYDWLLENFFHGLSPAVMRSVAKTTPLRHFFMMLVTILHQRDAARASLHVKMESDSEHIYVLLVGSDPGYKERVMAALEKLRLPPMHLMSTQLTTADSHVMGLMYQAEEELLRERFVQTLDRVLLEHDPLPIAAPWAGQYGG